MRNESVTMYADLYDPDNSSLAESSLYGPLRASHDLVTMFPDNDSGFGSYKAKSCHLTSEDFSPPPSRLTRSNSLTRLNSRYGHDTSENTFFLSENHDRTVHSLQNALEDSETRRNVLVDKLKEAQATLQLQNERLTKIENAASDNNAMVEDLKFKEREYRLKITQLQHAEEEKQALQQENVQLRQEMQARIDILDWQLNSLKSQHHNVEHENSHRGSLLDHTTQALSLLEQENTKFQKECDRLRDELRVVRDACELSKNRAQALEAESKSYRLEADKLRQENVSLTGRIQEMAGQMTELRNLLQAVKDDNERLSSSWKLASEDKHRVSRRAEDYQETIADLKSRLTAVTSDKDRLFHDRLDLNRRLQQLMLEKEQLLKTKMCLEEQLSEQKYMPRLIPRLFEKKDTGEELSAVKKVSEDLSSELATVRAFYERALEQLSASENNKRLQQQHLDLAQQEARRLQQEVDRLSQMLGDRHSDDQQERQHLDDTILKTRSELKNARYENDQLSNRIHELETKLQKANEGIRGGLDHWQEELESWKMTCDRLTLSISRKENDLKMLTDRCHGLEEQLSKVQEELRQSREKCEMVSDATEEVKRLKEEKRRLLQEKAENEQMLQLLETQRDVLSKNTESSLNQMQEVEHLSGIVDQLRNDNELSRQRITELEKVRDNLITQKEELLASSELIYKTHEMEDLEKKMEELRSANRQLRDINENISDKLQVLEQENLRLKRAIGEGPAKEGLKSLQEVNRQLKGEVTNLKWEKQKLIEESHAKQSTELQKLQRERDALQKQVQLINGQLNLVEGSKRRIDEEQQRTQEELKKVQAELKASQKECAEAQRMSRQVKVLSEQLQQAKAKQENQEKLIHSMKKESMEDTEAELQEMRGEIRKLKGEIARKEATIEALESQLHTACNTAEAKEQAVNDLKKLVSELEQQNSLYTSGSQAFVSSSPLSLTIGPKAGEKSLKDELEEAVRIKQVNFHPEIFKHVDSAFIGAANSADIFSNETDFVDECVQRNLFTSKEISTDNDDIAGEGFQSQNPPELLSYTQETRTQLKFAKPPCPSKSKPRRLPLILASSLQDVPPLTQLSAKPKISKEEESCRVEQWESASRAEDNSTDVGNGCELDLNRSEQSEQVIDSCRGRQLPVIPQEGRNRHPQKNVIVQSQGKTSSGSDESTKAITLAALEAENEMLFKELSQDADHSTSKAHDNILPGNSFRQEEIGSIFSAESLQDKNLYLQPALPDEMNIGSAQPGEFSTSHTLCFDTLSNPSYQSSSSMDVPPRNENISLSGDAGRSQSELRHQSVSMQKSTSASSARDEDDPKIKVDFKGKTHIPRSRNTATITGLQTAGRRDRFGSENGQGDAENKGNKDSRKEFLEHLSHLLENRQSSVSRSSIFRDRKKEKRTSSEVTACKHGLNLDKQKSLQKFTEHHKTVTWSHLVTDPASQDWHPYADFKADVDVLSKDGHWIEMAESDARSDIDQSPDFLTESHKDGKEGQSLKLKPGMSPFMSRSLSHPVLTASSHPAAGVSGQEGKATHRGRYGAMFFHKPEKPEAEGTGRLQSLISKYRSHSTDGREETSNSTEGGARQRVSSAPPTLHISMAKGQGWSAVAPKAPPLRPEKSLSPRGGRKFPPPPPPKPGKQSSLQGGSQLAAEVGTSGDRANPLLDSQERSDINALIQKQPVSTATKPLLSVHPPKITSKVIAGLLRTKKLS